MKTSLLFDLDIFCNLNIYSGTLQIPCDTDTSSIASTISNVVGFFNNKFVIGIDDTYVIDAVINPIEAYARNAFLEYQTWRDFLDKKEIGLTPVFTINTKKIDSKYLSKFIIMNDYATIESYLSIIKTALTEAGLKISDLKYTTKNFEYIV